MLLFADRSEALPGYRFVIRLTPCAPLPDVVRLRCTLSAADHSVVGIRTVDVAVSGPDACVELVLEPAAGGAPPKYFELVAAVVNAGATRGRAQRMAGIMDHAQPVIVLPPITFAGSGA